MKKSFNKLIGFNKNLLLTKNVEKMLKKLLIFDGKLNVDILMSKSSDQICNRLNNKKIDSRNEG